ncbi:hypothetical protein NQ314_010376 [Rhamnusium bicolor]|uniref:Uncharacterized protein n=1 Tax=Rhamnusium bicolor TaxID=1586634 RepID=A0AAV8XRT3_9CUCU|nr:hypothetical protein NQ314_010376 [Rhamnusium bicolor]
MKCEDISNEMTLSSDLFHAFKILYIFVKIYFQILFKMEETQSKLSGFVMKHGQIKAQLTRFATLVTKFDNDRCLIELTTRLEKIEIL